MSAEVNGQMAKVSYVNCPIQNSAFREFARSSVMLNIKATLPLLYTELVSRVGTKPGYLFRLQVLQKSSGEKKEKARRKPVWFNVAWRKGYKRE